MSGKIRNILLVFICIIIECGCQNRMIPAGYLQAPKQINKSITGGWVDVSVISDPSNDSITMLSGELLAVENDTFHILTAGTELISLNKNRIKSIKLYFFANPNLSLLGFLGVIPNIVGAISQTDYAGSFLLLGLPICITSLVMAIADYYDGNSTLRYPVKDSLSEFSRYARFPQGLPPDLQKAKLHLVIR
jgi:hypothetical protein